MKDPAVGSVPQADEAAAIATIVLAFAADPTARWTWPQSHEFLDAMPRLARAFGGKAFIHGGAFSTKECVGAALWLPPGVHPDEDKMGEVIRATVPSSRHNEVFATFDQMAKYHPKEPHWYLPVIGVDPAHQGKGHGEALMAHALARCDHDHVPAYLESSNPRNISLYVRHGFAPLGTIKVSSSAQIVPMLRQPR